ncbi:MAG: hypothetical protein N2257_05555 [Thermodesulfovibrionales bacterium]|nr:hypothetical protein [Thermodesulfovibrionales bacterium]
MTATLYLLFGLTLVTALTITILFYYSKKRKKKVEEPKYRMLQDD